MESFTRRSKRLNKRSSKLIIRLQDEQAIETLNKLKHKARVAQEQKQRTKKIQQYINMTTTKRKDNINVRRGMKGVKSVKTNNDSKMNSSKTHHELLSIPKKITSKKITSKKTNKAQTKTTMTTANAGKSTGILSRHVGCVDSAAANLLSSSSNVNVVTEHGDVYDVELVQIDLSKNIDKFYIMQLLANDISTQYYVFTKWGRTGSIGQTQLLPFTTFDEAKKTFESKFHEKTKNTWSNHKSFVKYPNAYNMIVVDHNYKSSTTKSDAVWEYYVDDYVDGKATGWYPYTANGAVETEKLWVSFQSNKDMIMRVIESGHFSYLVDFKNMQQTNVSHPNAKKRTIRRREVAK
jgi:predicted DNA-binding WGR domain protein